GELTFALQPDRAESDAAAAHLPRFGTDDGQRQAREHLLEKSLEVLATHRIFELQPLNSGLRQALAPIPRLQLAQRQPSEHHLITEKSEQRARRIGLEVLDLLMGDVEGALARGMAVAIECHRGERLSKGVEKASRVAAHRLTVAIAAVVRGVGLAALRMSGSVDAAASARRADARPSFRHPAASAINAASISSERAASRGRPSQFLPPSTISRSAVRAATFFTRPRTLMARTRSSEATAWSCASCVIGATADG